MKGRSVEDLVAAVGPPEVERDLRRIVKREVPGWRKRERGLTAQDRLDAAFGLIAFAEGARGDHDLA